MIKLLLIGFFLMLISNMRGSADVFAWFMLIPFLLYVTLYHGLKSRLWLLLTFVAGSILVLAKTTSEPVFVSAGFSVMTGAVIGLRYFITFLAWDYIRKWAGERIGLIAFPAVVVTFEYLQAFHTQFGTWGSLAFTQLSNLPLLQTASLFGFLGISALMAWGAVLAASLILERDLAKNKIHIVLFIIVFIALNVWGDLRLNGVAQGKQVLAAAIVNGIPFTGETPDPNDPDVLSLNQALINRTRQAARHGAELALWGEGSTVISEKGEGRFLRTLSQVARSNRMAIIAAYAIPLPKDQQVGGNEMINKYTWIGNNGSIAQTYLKHHPVPGEGSVPGKAPLKVIPTKYGNMAGDICYDDDFPQMSLTYARLGADLVLNAGLDWPGILYRHTLMARVHAIEGGFSFLRSANGATSMGFDNLGRIRASMASSEDNDHIMLASLPVKRTVTLYSRVGNIIAYIAIVALIGFFFIAIKKRLVNSCGL